MDLSKAAKRILSIVVVITTATVFCSSIDREKTLRRRQLNLDPKSVEIKSVAKKVIDNAPKDLSKLRYVTFGSSHVYGSGVSGEEGHTRFDAFPYLLSPNVTNLAMKSHNFDYPFLCLESMISAAVGDDVVFDVAVLMEPSVMPWDDQKKEVMLGQRLRQRFPDIILIYVHHVNALTFKWVWNDHKKGFIMINRWEKEVAGVGRTDPSFVPKMKEFAEEHKNEGEWKDKGLMLNNYDKKSMNENIAQMQRNLGENTYFIDIYYDANDPITYFENFGLYTVNDYHHPSAIGHAHYADAIKQTVQKALPNYPTNPHLASSWEKHDKCVSWFQLVGRDEKDIITFPREGFELDCFGHIYVPKEKCSLKLVSDKGSITVTNAAKEDQHLSIMFMATSPSHPDISYPSALIETFPKGMETPRVVKTAVPVTAAEKYQTKGAVHVVKLITLGTIPPGETMIQFRNLEMDKKDPFRIVSYLITDTEGTHQGTTTS